MEPRMLRAPGVATKFELEKVFRRLKCSNIEAASGEGCLELGRLITPLLPPKSFSHGFASVVGRPGEELVLEPIPSSRPRAPEGLSKRNSALVELPDRNLSLKFIGLEFEFEF